MVGIKGWPRDIHVALYLRQDLRASGRVFFNANASTPAALTNGRKMETPLLNGGAEEGYGGADGDYQPLRSWREVRSMVWKETVKLWRVAGPLAFQILCQFGTNSMTSVFVGHIGNLQLSAVSISLSVIGTFSFGFMVGFLFSLSLFSLSALPDCHGCFLSGLSP